jgi:hypothetical protein
MNSAEVKPAITRHNQCISTTGKHHDSEYNMRYKHRQQCWQSRYGKYIRLYNTKLIYVVKIWSRRATEVLSPKTSQLFVGFCTEESSLKVDTSDIYCTIHRYKQQGTYFKIITSVLKMKIALKYLLSYCCTYIPT